jgi:hypothetical protein
MEHEVTVTDLHGMPGTITTWTDDGEGEGKAKLALKVDVGPFSVAYLDHAAVVSLIKELSSAARVVD